MARPGSFLFVTWAGGGNVPPLVALARRLRARGHRVRVLGSGDLAGRFVAEALPFRAYRSEEAWRDGLAEDVAAEARRQPTDVAVVDYMQPAAMCGAEAAPCRVVALLHTLYTSVALGEFSPMRMAATDEGIATLRRRLGLEPIAHVTDLLDRAACVLVLTTREFDGADGAGSGIPPNLRYVGPIVEDAGPDRGWSPPWPDERPLVVVSLGTTPMDEGPLLQTVLAAFEALPVHVFATVGNHLDPANFRAPANAVVAGYVRHAAVLPHAATYVTHAGLSGIGAALTYGVPMLCIPLGREQPANARRVEAIGAGLVLGSDATVSDLRRALRALLDDPSYRTAATDTAAAIRADGSGAVAVDALEQLL
jgi:UDP:flavonoid glycosyltransferase YjiC (YdhE family)